MRIAYVAAGAGEMYCGACARDAVLARAIRGLGHELQLIPLYTPLKIDQRGIDLGPVFLGGISVFLGQRSAVFRSLPSALTRWLDHPALLRRASRSTVSIDARQLGDMTVSVLLGRDGRQRRQLNRLLAYLRRDFRPDVVHLTNSLLSGLAPEVKRQLRVPVVCTFQGEDQFVSGLPGPCRVEARQLVRANAGAIDLVLCPCVAVMDEVSRFLGVEKQRLRVVRTAVESAPRASPPGRFVVGCLSTIREAKGQDRLVEALHLLVNQRRLDVTLRLAGRVTEPAFWRRILRLVAARGLSRRVEYVGEIDERRKREFLGGCSVFAFAGRNAEPRGVAVMEAMSAGVPVVVPRRGVFPELLALGGGGTSYADGDPVALADAIEIDGDHEWARRSGDAARESMRLHCSPEQAARQTLAGYASLLPAASA